MSGQYHSDDKLIDLCDNDLTYTFTYDEEIRLYKLLTGEDDPRVAVGEMTQAEVEFYAAEVPLIADTPRYLVDASVNYRLAAFFVDVMGEYAPVVQVGELLLPTEVAYGPTLIIPAVSTPLEYTCVDVAYGPTLVTPAVSTPVEYTCVDVAYGPTLVTPAVSTPAKYTCVDVAYGPTLVTPNVPTTAEYTCIDAAYGPTLDTPAALAPAEYTCVNVAYGPTRNGVIHAAECNATIPRPAADMTGILPPNAVKQGTPPISMPSRAAVNHGTLVTNIPSILPHAARPAAVKHGTLVVGMSDILPPAAVKHGTLAMNMPGILSPAKHEPPTAGILLAEPYSRNEPVPACPAAVKHGPFRYAAPSYAGTSPTYFVRARPDDSPILLPAWLSAKQEAGMLPWDEGPPRQAARMLNFAKLNHQIRWSPRIITA